MLAWAVSAAAVLSGCSCDDPLRAPSVWSEEAQRRTLDGGSHVLDASADVEAGVVEPSDAGRTEGSLDASAPADATLDAGFGLDAGPETDAGFATDVGPAGDAALDAGASPDAAAAGDASLGDAGPRDAATGDAGSGDAAVAGSSDLWIELSYGGAFTPSSPSWSYSMSSGWTAASWAFNAGSGAEAWDRWNNMSVVNDPIGRALEIGSGSELQLMFGLVPLIGYVGATVELEGRSRATSSRVLFDIYNPANGCGVAGAEMDQDWTPDVVQLDLTGCFTAGSNLQAVRVEPTSGTIALRRLRLTLHGARW